MPRVEAGSGGGLRVSGLYVALLEHERRCQDRADRRSVALYPADDGVVFRRSRHLLDKLEAGEPVVVRGHDLGGWRLPKVPLRAEQKAWPNRYTVTPDDRVRRRLADDDSRSSERPLE
jgi:hypothetical protein